MPTTQIFTGTGITKYNYLPGVLRENKSGWIIEYYVEHPTTHTLTRKQIRLKRLTSRYKSIRDARLHISKIIENLNAKLSGGWNPYFVGEDARMYEKLTTVTELFLKEKTKELRPNTMRSYNSFCFLLNDWIKKTSPGLIASMFNHLYAVKYMDHVYNNRNVNVTTYNNNIKMGRALFNWMRERCYTAQNPFEQIKTKPKPLKKRIPIPPDVRVRIIKHLESQDNNFLIVCKLVFSALIRPNEIRLLKVQDIHLKEKYIRVDEKISKNGKTRFAALTPDVIHSIEKLNLDRYPGNYYFLSSYFVPDKVPAGNGCYGGAWDKLRKELKLPAEMQLYSFRDSGIFEMLKSGIDDLSVMQHADHSSLDITTIYANHHDPNLINKISNKAPAF